jgi:hypothetical protein
VFVSVREGKLRSGVSIWAVGLALYLAAPVPAAAQAAAPHPTDTGGRARDCTTEAELSDEAPSIVRYVVWCGVQSGRVTLRIRRPEGPAVLGFSQTAQAAGPGAAGPLHCRPRRGGRVFCSGRSG